MKSRIESLYQNLNTRIARTPVLSGFNLQALARPSARLVTRPASDELGGSRLGGAPDVPHGFEWPRWAPPIKHKKGFFGWLKRNQPVQAVQPPPLGFIAQIDLSAIPRVDDVLPVSGWLYFFYDRYHEPWGFDPSDRGGCRVIYASCNRSELRRTNPPDDANPEHIAQMWPVDARPELTLPDELPNVEYGTPVDEAYRQLLKELATSNDPTHRLLGHPQLIQNEMELECQLASNGINCGGVEPYDVARAKSLEPGAADWRLLLQIDTDEEGPGWMWGDVGRIYFWIREQDLRALCFDDAWLVLQCF